MRLCPKIYTTRPEYHPLARRLFSGRIRAIFPGSAAPPAAGFFVSCSARTGAGPNAHRKVSLRDYEAVYIFDSALEEPQINEKLDRFHALVAGDNGGEVTEVEHWGRRQLAYPIRDRENGYYVVSHFRTAAEALPEFERLLQLDEGLLRYLIVVNEGDLATKPAEIVERSEDEDEEEED